MKSSLVLLGVAAVLATVGCASKPKPSATYYLDVHEFGPGKVTAEAVAQAHRSDLSVQHKHGVRFVEYFVDEAAGKVLCLSESPDAAAVIATHREAHGLIPATVVKVTRGD